MLSFLFKEANFRIDFCSFLFSMWKYDHSQFISFDIFHETPLFVLFPKKKKDDKRVVFTYNHLYMQFCPLFDLISI